MDPEIFSHPKDILGLILESKQNGTAIGIKTPILGRVLALVGVQDLIFYDAPVVMLKPYDAQGQMLSTTAIPLDDIEFVKPFASKFENPFITRL